MSFRENLSLEMVELDEFMLTKQNGERVPVFKFGAFGDADVPVWRRYLRECLKKSDRVHLMMIDCPDERLVANPERARASGVVRIESLIWDPLREFVTDIDTDGFPLSVEVPYRLNERLMLKCPYFWLIAGKGSDEGLDLPSLTLERELTHA